MFGKHPRPLAMLFFTEMWERFSYYGMRALLVLYVSTQLFGHMQEPENKIIAYGILGAYGSLVYATPFFGGIIADKLLGYRKSVLLGAVLMMIGHFLMAIENHFFFYMALAFLIAGNGFFKPNISSMVGKLYTPDDRRRDQGFTIFYMGINLGALLTPWICGWLGQEYSWHYGFGAAGIGMLLGLIIFYKNEKLLENIGLPPKEELLSKKIIGIKLEHLIYAGSILSTALFAYLVKNYHLLENILLFIALGIIGSILVVAIMQKKEVRERLFVVIILLAFSTLFWAFFEQAASSINLFTNENVDRAGLPASVFQSINPLFIFIFALPFSAMWSFLGKRKKEPNTPIKFSFGLLLLGLGFIVLASSNYFIGITELNIGTGNHPEIILAASVPLLFLVAGYWLHTLGELCLSPIGLSMVTKLSPPRMTAIVMGAWFISSSLAHHFGGAIAMISAKSDNINPTELVIEKFSAELEQLGYENTNDKKVQMVINDAVAIGMKVVHNAAKDQYASTPDKFKVPFAAAADSCLLKLKNANIPIKDADLRPALEAAIMQGGFVYAENGIRALNKAESKGFIDKEDRSKFKVITTASLSNLLSFNSLFKSLGYIAIGASLLLFLISPFIKKMMHGLH